MNTGLKTNWRSFARILFGWTMLWALGVGHLFAGSPEDLEATFDQSCESVESGTLGPVAFDWNGTAEEERRRERDDTGYFIPNRRGFYVGMGFGLTARDDTWGDDDEEAGVRIFVGGRFSPFLAAEVAWTFYDDDDWDGDHWWDDDDWCDHDDDYWDEWDPEFQASFHLIGIIPLNQVDLYGKFGIVHWIVDGHWYRDDCDDWHWECDDDDNDVGLGVGAGFLFHTSRHVGLRGEIEVSTLDDDIDNDFTAMFAIQFTF